MFFNFNFTLKKQEGVLELQSAVEILPLMEGIQNLSQ